jgi:hypothetical protein
MGNWPFSTVLPLSHNPWPALPEKPPFVLPDDAPFLAAYNRFASARNSIDLRMIPEPWVGDIRATVVVLNLNPGIGGDEDLRWHRRLSYRAILRATLERRRSQYPLHHLDPWIADCPGARWWRRCLKQVIAATSVEATARLVVGMEFHGYHSMSYAALPVTLPSQRYVFTALRAALARGAVIVSVRGLPAWSVAVPELVGYRRLWRVRNPRMASVSTKNVGDTGFKAVVAAVGV